MNDLFDRTDEESQQMPYASPFSHENETAEPGYYSVMLDTYGIKAEITATQRTAIYRFTFPQTDSATLIVDLDYNLDVFGFEQGETNKVWYNWGNFPTAVPNDPAGEHPEIMTIADGGANGTAKCMKIDISQCYGDCVWEFAHRNNWPNNPWLTSGEKYELSLWFRADLPAEGTMAGCMWLNIFTFVPDYLNDPLRALKASDSWSAVFDGDEFVVTSQTKLWEGVITTIGGTAEAPEFNGLLTTEWQKYTFEFTVEEGNAGDIFKNCYLAFGLTGVGATVYVDEIQLNLIEE